MTRLLQSLEDLKIKETDLEYLKIKEVASQLRADGYSVTESPSGIDDGFDIVATKDDKKLAVEVKTSSRLQASAETIKNLRKRALEQGFDEFRLIIVNPPREVTVSIEGLEEKLLMFLSENFPDALDELSSHTILQDVNDINIDSIQVTTDGVQVIGNGVVDVELNYGNNSEGISSNWSFPFSFDVTLDHELEISSNPKIAIDKSSWDE